MLESFASPRWRVDLMRAALSGIGGIVGLAAAGWPSDAALAAFVVALGGVLGFILARCMEYLGNQRSKLAKLEGIERQVAAEREQAAFIKEQLEWQVQVAKREAALNAVSMKVYADAFAEVGGPQRIPFEAMLARIEVTKKAQNLHLPVPPPQVPGNQPK